MSRGRVARYAVVGALMLFFASFAGMYSWLQLQKYRAKKEVRAMMVNRIAPETIQTFRFAKHSMPTAMRWVHEDEFEYGGRLYDVIITREFGDSVVFEAWADDRESALNAHIRALTNRWLQAESGPTADENRWVQFLKQLMPPPVFYSLRIPAEGKQPYSESDVAQPVDPQQEPVAPPPEALA